MTTWMTKNIQLYSGHWLCTLSQEKLFLKAVASESFVGREKAKGKEEDFESSIIGKIKKERFGF